jgi:bifunctional DNase/RNase
VITDRKESTFFANVFLDGSHGAISVDARPGGSVASALRSRAPIFFSDSRCEKSAQTATTEEPKAEKTPEEKAEELRRYLEHLRPEDFGGQWKSEDV